MLNKKSVDDINVNNIGRGENADKADNILKKQELNDSTINGASKIDLSEQTGKCAGFLRCLAIS